MTFKRLRIGIVGVLCCASQAAARDPWYDLSYVRRGSAPDSAIVRFTDGRLLEIRRGEPSEVGELRSVDDAEIVLDRPADAIGPQHPPRPGQTEPDVLRLHLRRSADAALGLIPLPKPD